MALVEGAPGNAADVQRFQNFMSAAKAAGVAFNKVADVTGQWTPSAAQSACQNVLSAHPSIPLIYAESDDMASGCAEAVTAAHAAAKIIGVGGETIAINPIKSASSPIYGTVCYQPNALGKLAFQTLYDYLTGANTATGRFVTYTTPGVTHSTVSQCVPQW